MEKLIESHNAMATSIIQWADYDTFYGLDYSTRLGKYKDYTFDIRYDYDGDIKIKPENCGMCLCIYFKRARIEGKLGNLIGLTNYSEMYIQNEISKAKNNMEKLLKKHWDVVAKEPKMNFSDAHANITTETAIGFAEWIALKRYSKRYYTHPNKVGKWFSDYEDNGYLTTSELFTIYIEQL
jgi:hypothetical protein